MSKSKSDEIVFDPEIPGFGIRTRIGGSKTFVFQYKIGAKQRRMTLGRTSVISAEDARQLAMRFYADIKQFARDPQGERYATLRQREILHGAEAEVAATMKIINGLGRKINAGHP